MTMPVLLDVTRAAMRCWQGRTPNGIDRVGEAYARHFAARAQAVMQFRGRPAIFGADASRRLIEAMEKPAWDFRNCLLSLWRDIPAAIAKPTVLPGSIYLNVTHTDFDLAAHRAWTERTKLRAVYLLHDLIPLRHPEVTTPRKVRRHQGRVEHALNHAAAIVVNSQSTADDLAAHAADRLAKSPPVLVAPLGIEGASQPACAIADGKPYFVSLGTIEKRKNQVLLLRAWQHMLRRMGSNTPRLLLIGSLGAGSREVRAMIAADSRLQRHVEMRAGLADAQVLQLLAGSRAMLFPSRAEGFGLPVAEALAHGVPVIASNLAALREIGGGIPCLLDPQDAQAWAEKIAQFCQDTPERQLQLARMSTFRTTTWAEHFAALDDWLHLVACNGELVDSHKASKPANWPQSAPRKLEASC